MANEQLPNPDEILKSIQSEETHETTGKLKIFFGMSAGVGKTYAMLSEAQQKLKEGVDVVIGVVNTHGRIETENLLKDLPVIPEKWQIYRKTAFRELDLQAILERKPSLVLIDELAHENVPGSKHSKRWQDVVEILDAGIDVFATLNVQHLESRKDDVEKITGIRIRETVPDLILEKAVTVELVDISPQGLLKRLKEGKVYTGDISQIAIENFFKESTLTALRDIALRFTAEKVEHDLHGILAGEGEWRLKEKLMAVIGPHAESEKLIRIVRRRAFELDASWCALYIDTGKKLRDEDQKRLVHNLTLVRELGGEAITTIDPGEDSGIVRMARSKNISQIYIGMPLRRKWYECLTRSLPNKLHASLKNVDIIIVRQETEEEETYAVKESRKDLFKQYLVAMGSSCILVLFSAFLHLHTTRIIGIVLLVAVFGLSFILKKGPVVVVALATTLAWNFFFLTPIYQLKLTRDNLFFSLVYFISGALIGVLNSALREQRTVLRQRESNLYFLYEMDRLISQSKDLLSLKSNLLPYLQKQFSGLFDIRVVDKRTKMLSDFSIPIENKEKEDSVAYWVLRNGKPAGKFTDTLPAALAMYYPIKSHGQTLGVLCYLPKKDLPLLPWEHGFIQNVSELTGIFLERFLLEESEKRHEYVRERERLHNAIFRSLSKGFYAPLERMRSLRERLARSTQEEDVLVFLNEFEQSRTSLQFIVDNFLAISEIDSGFLHFDKKSYPITSLIEHTLVTLEPFLENREITSSVKEPSPQAQFDFKLMVLALKNIILNALENAPKDLPVLIEAKSRDSEMVISVVDSGPGIPEEMLPLIFEKFFSAKDTKGIGLGLSVVQSVMDVHQGKIEVTRRDSKETVFTLILPLSR